MLEKLDFMVRFWDLRARHGAGRPLTALERGELLSLLSLMVSDDPMPDPGQARAGDGLPLQIASSTGFLDAELVHVCATGLVVVAAAPLSIGQSAMARVTDAASGIEYGLPCVVAWTYVGTHTTMALRVDGAPTRVHCTAPPDAMAWTAPLGWPEPAVALAE